MPAPGPVPPELVAPILGRPVAVVGYGNQGSAHARNLREAGATVVVGARPGGDAWTRAVRDDFPVRPIPEAVGDAGLTILALPDEAHRTCWRDVVAPHLAPGSTAGVLHGFSVRYGLVEPRADCGLVMVAPKGPGATLRARFAEGSGIPCMLAVHHDPPGAHAEAIAHAWAHGIGCGRAAIVRTTIALETESDLFGEQAVLCGGMMALAQQAFDALVAAGFPSEVAYIECVQEIKQVADLLYARGPAGMMAAISNTAEHGAYDAMRRFDHPALRAILQEILAAVRDGSYAQRFLDDTASGALDASRLAFAASDLERASAAVRPWFAPPPRTTTS